MMCSSPFTSKAILRILLDSPGHRAVHYGSSDEAELLGSALLSTMWPNWGLLPRATDKSFRAALCVNGGKESEQNEKKESCEISIWVYFSLIPLPHQGNNLGYCRVRLQCERVTKKYPRSADLAIWPGYREGLNPGSGPSHASVNSRYPGYSVNTKSLPSQ